MGAEGNIDKLQGSHLQDPCSSLGVERIPLPPRPCLMNPKADEKVCSKFQGRMLGQAYLPFAEINIIDFPMLVLKIIYHYWIQLNLFQGCRGMRMDMKGGNFRASGSVRRHCPLPFLLLPLFLVSLVCSVVLSPSLCSHPPHPPKPLSPHPPSLVCMHACTYVCM